VGEEKGAELGLRLLATRPRGKDWEGFGAFGLKTSGESFVCLFFFFKAYFKII